MWETERLEVDDRVREKLIATNIEHGYFDFKKIGASGKG
jgi:hypothetical protein